MSTNHRPQVMQLESRTFQHVHAWRSRFGRQRAATAPGTLQGHRPTPFPPFYRWARWPGA